MKRYLNLRQGDVRLRCVEDNTSLYDGDVFYVTCIGEKEELLFVYGRFKKSDNYNCILQQELHCEEYWCEIMPHEATKGNAIKELKDILNCDRIISFGDAMNDIPMFSISNECYAVENATDELKKVATGIIGSNNEDGVARWLMKYLK